MPGASPEPAHAAAWRPTASMPTLRARAELLQRLRAYFVAHEVLEVETPILQPGANLDPGVTPQRVETSDGPRWIPTSPEHPLKRLVAAGSGAVWTLAPVVRVGERGQRHLSEFRMLEWYRPDWPLERLIAETCAVLALISGLSGPIESTTWREAFRQHAGLDPHHASNADVLARCHGLPSDATREESLDWLWSSVVESQLGRGCWSVIRDWPGERAAQARVRCDADGFIAAQRFEIVREGIELANGYDECPDADTLRQRFSMLQRHDEETDQRLLAALAAGFPACSGVAVGFDRCVMLALGLSTVRECVAFADG